MDLKKKTIIIGLGNCGCKMAKLFADVGYDAMFANGSEQDLKVLGNMKGIYKLNGFDGFGGHRDRAMDCLALNPEFTDALEHINQKIIFLVYAVGGSTGSGLSTIVSQYLQDVYDGEKIICSVPVLPSSDEAINKHRNAYQAISELMQLDGMGATFFIDDNNGDDLRWINKSFASLLNAFLTDDSWGEPNNFDESERLEMLSEPGAMIISLQKPTDGLSRLVDDNIFAPLQKNKVCGNIGIIHSGKNDVDIDKLVAEIGKPLNISEGWGGKGTLIAVSGLSFPVDHVSQIGKLALEGQKERQRNIELANSQMLPSLDFEDVKTVSIIPTMKTKKTNSRDALMALRAKKA